MLNAAALTYVAALAQALAQLLFMVFRAGGRATTRRPQLHRHQGPRSH